VAEVALMRPQAAILPGGRLHLSHGPIDLVIGADGDRAAAFDAAQARFESVLEELVAELPLLRRPLSMWPKGAIARRMYKAAEPFADGVTTPMICVAGAVAETVLAAMVGAADLTRAYVNNGGDIALHLTGAARFSVVVAALDGKGLGHIDLCASDPVRGIATSGQRGRSLSLGIADAVTVLAPTAAMADAAATILANTVDLTGHPAIHRQPACEVQDDSDLGTTPVVRHVGPLTPTEVAHALKRGQDHAEIICRRGLIHGAALFLRDQNCMTGLNGMIPELEKEAEPCLTS
jgi:hypothetical protein